MGLCQKGERQLDVRGRGRVKGIVGVAIKEVEVEAETEGE